MSILEYLHLTEGKRDQAKCNILIVGPKVVRCSSSGDKNKTTASSQFDNPVLTYASLNDYVALEMQIHNHFAQNCVTKNVHCQKGHNVCRLCIIPCHVVYAV